jgi:transcriptional regulator with XRE-family HTH domain
MFKENFERLCNGINKAPTTVCQEIGLSNAVYAKWNEKSIPHRSTLIKIADYFGVTPESLVAENEQKKSPSEVDEDKILKDEIAKIFSNLLPEQQEQAKVYLRYLLDTQEKTYQDNP